MIQFEGVEKGYGGQVLFQELSFKINKGERCGLVGRNGSGKSTLLRMMTGEEEPDRGEVVIPKGYTVGYLSQHLAFSGKCVVEEVGARETYMAEKMLFGLGFKQSDMQRDPLEFSGGYQLRIELAKVLLAEPDCLLLDEPTNYLDIVSIRWLTRFLQGWNGELVVISHDRLFMDAVTTHTLGVHRQGVKKMRGDTATYYAALLHEEQVHEQTRINMEKKREKMGAFITRLGAKASKAKQAQSKKKALDRLPVLEELAKLHHLDFIFPYAPFPGKRMVEMRGVDFSYTEAPLIEGVDLAIDKGERIAIVGKNGRGKSTLLGLMAGEHEPTKGSITRSNNLEIGYFGQSNIERLHPNKTVEEEISGANRELSIGQVRSLCGLMLFSGDLAKKPINVLSGGEKSRVLLGKILAKPCNLLLLDEPTNHLDMESIEALMGALEAFEGAIVLVSHSEALLGALPEKFIVCHEGSQHLFWGDYDLFLEKEGWEEQKKAPKPKRAKEDRKATARSIAKTEKEIMQLEVEIEKIYQELITAREGSLIKELNSDIETKKKRIELLFEQLEELMRS